MAILTRDDLVSGLTRLGELAANEGLSIDLLVVGGCAMVLGFDARLSTRDVDAVIVSPSERATVRRWIEQVAAERDWPSDWLNDAAKGYLSSTRSGREVLSVHGLRACIPPTEVLLAMKLTAWRDDVDIADARRLLAELKLAPDEAWQRVSEHLLPGRELKARLAFDDLLSDSP